MIGETVTSLDPEWGDLIDVDLLESGEWTGLFRLGESHFVRTPQSCVPAPSGIRFPLVRSLDSERCVVVDRRTQDGRENGWILSLKRQEVRTFFAGDGIEDVLASADAIVVTYFDEGVFGGRGPSDQGVAVFTNEGELRAGYQSFFGAEAVDVADCYAACWDNDSEIAFLPYTGFPLVRWDLDTLEQRVAGTPQVVNGASAISTVDDTVLFYSPYKKRDAIFSWSLDRRPCTIGSYPGPLRGLRGGRFLARGNRGFTVVDPFHQKIAAGEAGTRP